MAQNAVYMRDRVDFYNDVSRNARFFFQDYEKAINDAIKVFVDQKIKKDEIDDEIETLIKTAAGSITAGTTVTGRYGTFIPNHINYPSDYYDFIKLSAIIDGYTVYARATDFNKEGPLLDNVFMKPTNVKPYYLMDGTGIIIWRGSAGTFASCIITYVKVPAVYVLGLEANVIAAPTALTAAAYIALETTVFNGVTYKSGAAITGSALALTSGSAILTSLTTPSDLPDKVLESVCKIAAQLMQEVTGDVQKVQLLDKEIAKNN